MGEELLSERVTDRMRKYDDANRDMESLMRLMARINALVQELPDLLAGALPVAVGLADEPVELTTYQETVRALGHGPWEATA